MKSESAKMLSKWKILPNIQIKSTVIKSTLFLQEVAKDLVVKATSSSSEM